MSYSHSGLGVPPRTSDEVCFPREAIMRMLPRAAGPTRELVTLTGGYESVPIPWERGVLLIDPRYEPNWEIPKGTL